MHFPSMKRLIWVGPFQSLLPICSFQANWQKHFPWCIVNRSFGRSADTDWIYTFWSYRLPHILNCPEEHWNQIIHCLIRFKRIRFCSNTSPWIFITAILIEFRLISTPMAAVWWTCLIFVIVSYKINFKYKYSLISIR